MDLLQPQPQCGIPVGAMRIALIHVQFHEGNNLFPPLGLLYVAGALRAAGHRVRVWDGDPWLETDLVDRVCDFDPEVVGLSFLTMTWTRAVELALALRARLPGLRLMAGGPHATAEPDTTLAALQADVVVIGEGERTAVAVLDAWQAGRDPTGTPGTLTRQGKGAAAVPIADLDAVPLPARDLTDFERYLSPPGLIRGLGSARHASVLAGRGCRYRCTFCASHLQLGRDLRMRSPAGVVAEIDELVRRYSVRGLYFVDDIFTGDRHWVRAFCDLLEKRGHDLEWACQSRVESVDRVTLVAMQRAGCAQIDFGVESGSKAVLRRMKKGTAREPVVRAFDLVHETGMRTGASFILGSPGEAEEDVADTLELAERIRSDWTVFFFSTPYPGTDLWRELHAGGTDVDFPAWGEAWNNRQSQTPFDIGGLAPARLAELRRVAQNRHFKSNYLRRRNLRFGARLAALAAAQPRLWQQAVRTATTGGRLDDLVEACFAADRAERSLRRAPTALSLQRP
jgi:anaerobic magnesium-protoporphyrin IX monomethyl ester cyclase